MQRSTEEHTWHTRSSHVTSEGRVHYQHCGTCGRWRLVIDAFARAGAV